MNVVESYARDVVKGRIPAGQWHKKACQRHLNDLDRQGAADFPYVFDLDAAERFWRFAEKLKHYRGEWAGQFIRLEPWQKFITGCVLGWKHKDTGRRRFRNAFTQVPRKNGKTLLAAIVLLYLTFFDGEPGAAGYSVATKRDQAKISFTDCRQLVLSSGLKSRISVQVANLHQDATASKLEPLGADHDSTDGLNPSVVLVDEMHAMKDRGMLDVMETATGARSQPMIYIITTFGNEPVSPWGDQHDYACKILDGVLVNEAFFVFTASADPDDDWTSQETARKANPNYGISVNPDDLADKVLKAQGIPAASATYKQKHLNLLVNAFNPCLSVDGWRKGQSKWAETDLIGRRCYVGIDIASKLDLMACAFVFPPEKDGEPWKVIPRIWTPADTLVDRAHRDRAPYDVWRDQGWLTAIPGQRMDSDVVRTAILEARDKYDIQQIGFDPWHSDVPVKNLIALDGFSETQVLEVPQTYAGMSMGCLELQAEILAGRVDARGCPVTAWCVSNTVGQQDGKGNLMFTKDPKKSKGRIDPVIAMGIGFTMYKRLAPETESVYATRGLISI